MSAMALPKRARRSSSRQARAGQDDKDNWIAELTKRAAGLEQKAHGNHNHGQVHAPSKAVRVARREEKKQRRRERLAAAAVASRRKPLERSDEQGETSKDAVRREQLPTQPSARQEQRRLSAVRLEQLNLFWKERLLWDASVKNATTPAEAKKRKLSAVPDPEPSFQDRSPKRSLSSKTIQPRKRDYGGCGLARPSLLLRFDDPSFVPKLQEEFAEHVQGFYGKHHTKAMKKQQDANMLWRQRLREKQQRERLET